MSPRKRAARKRDLPANLYERNGYYSWRNPIDGKEHGLGRDKRAAVVQAVEANVHIAGLDAKARLVDRLTGVSERSFGAWMDQYELKIAERVAAGELKENTRKSYATLHGLARELIDGALPIEKVTTLQISEALSTVLKRGNARTAQALRSRLKEIFRSARAAGWVKEDPVGVTDSVKVKVNRARLSWEVFKRLYDTTEVIWLRNAMALALVSAQRREDISLAVFKDMHDEGWWCEQIKTGTRVFLPMELRLDVFSMSLEDVVRQCRTTGVLSKHLVHQTRPYGNSPVGRRIWKDTISRTFSSELAALGPMDWEGRDPPTFHEIRSLAERLYNKQGDVNTQELLGHKDPRSTALYHDTRGMEWVRVQVGSAKK